MTFGAVGSALTPTVTGKTFPLTPSAVHDAGGDHFVVFEVISTTAADFATVLSSTNVTWDPVPLVPHTALSANNVVSTVFKGKVTAASLATVTVTTAAGTPVLRVAGLELSTTAGYASVQLDADGTVNAASALCPDILPAHGAGEAYFYFGFNAGSSTNGTTSGYTYGADASGNGLCFNAACGSGAQQPAFGASDTISGLAVLLYEALPVSPLTLPHSAAAHRSARRGAAKGSPGAPRVAVIPPTGSPIADTTGAAILDTAGLPVEDTLSALAPFPQPGKAPAPHPAARKGATAGSPGAAYVFVPVIPAPFAQPDHAASGRPSARKGAVSGSPGAPVRPQPAVFAQPHRGVRGASPRRAGAVQGSPGAPWMIRLPASPFAQPNKAVAGRKSARKGTASASAPRAASPLVQTVSGSTTGTSLTLTFPAPVTFGHAVIIAVCGFDGGTVSGITLGGTGSTFTEAATSGTSNAEIWANLFAQQASGTIVITTSAAGILAWAYEVSGAVALDTSASESGSGTSWSSGNTAQTIPYPHLAVGIGTVVSNAGSITATGAGWVNSPAVTDVVGAGGHAIGGVSGYTLAGSPAEFAYIGSAGTGSAWGSAVAAFLVQPPSSSGFGLYGTGWGGYTFSEHAAAGYTGITATFTIPTVTAANLDSIWVGLGNVYQCGIYQTYNASLPGNSATRPWSWWLPGAGQDWSAAAWPTSAGDSLTLAIQLTAVNWLMTITNNTQGWTFTEVKSVLAVNTGSILNNGAGPAFWPYPVGTAEVIIEREGVPLPNYGTLTFTSITTTPPVSQPPTALFTVNAAIDQYPGPFNLANGSFTMHWNAAN